MEEPKLLNGVKKEGDRYIKGRLSFSFHAYRMYLMLVDHAYERANFRCLQAVNAIHKCNAGLINNDTAYGDATKPLQTGFALHEYGVKVLGKSTPSGQYEINIIVPDQSLIDFMNTHTQKKAGLYDVFDSGKGWKVIYNHSASVSSSNSRLKHSSKTVVVCDRAYPNVEDAVKINISRLKNHHDLDVKTTGFHLYFTPGIKRIGGVKNFRQSLRPHTSNDIRETATQLAKIMKDSVQKAPKDDPQDITWFGDIGGSGIITQAMANLDSEGVKLTNHKLALYQASTSKLKAALYHKKLEMKGEVKHYSEGFSFKEFIGGRGFMLPFTRAKDKFETYGAWATFSILGGIAGGIWTGITKAMTVNKLLVGFTATATAVSIASGSFGHFWSYVTGTDFVEMYKVYAYVALAGAVTIKPAYQSVRATFPNATQRMANSIESAQSAFLEKIKKKK